MENERSEKEVLIRSRQDDAETEKERERGKERWGEEGKKQQTETPVPEAE